MRIHHDLSVYVMILAMILTLTPSASAAWSDLLCPGCTSVISFIGMGTEFKTTDINGIKSYNIGEEGQAIVKIEHKVNPGTSGQEDYYLSDGSIIHSNYSCSWGYLFSTCNLGLSYLDRSLYVTRNDFQIIPKQKSVTNMILVNGTNGTLGFGIGVNQISTFYYVLDVNELKYLPIKSVIGSASQVVDLNIGFMTYDSFGNFINQVETVTEGGIITTFWNIWNTGSTIIGILIYYFKLVFIDNPILAFIFAEIMILTYSLSSRDMAVWWERIIKGHYALFEFLLRIMNTFVDVIAKVLSAFRII